MTAPFRLSSDAVRRLVAAALAEDVGAGDVTTSAVVGPEVRAIGRFVAREKLVVCGLPLARDVFDALDASLSWRERAHEGDEVSAGSTIAAVEGRGTWILTGERTALNFLQRLSGIATLARAAVREVAGTGAIVLDTRKTTPTLREIEKYAVRVGGASNHRAGLYDAVLIKDNHIALAGGVREAIARAKEAGHDPATIEIEVDDLEQAREALESGAGRLLLDNFSVEEVARAACLIAGRAKIEVSGGLIPGRLRSYAQAGADFVSVGRLTHSAPAADVSLEVKTTSQGIPGT